MHKGAFIVKGNHDKKEKQTKKVWVACWYAIIAVDGLWNIEGPGNYLEYRSCGRDFPGIYP